MQNLKIIFLIIELVFFHEISFSQRETNDTSNVSHFVYVVPSSLLGNLFLNLENYWVEIGYGYRYKKSMWSIGMSAIVHSVPNSGGAFLWPGISSVHSNGFSSNFEHRRIFFGLFYSSLQLNYEYIETVRSESYEDELNQSITSNYKVFRNEIALIPRVGFVFLQRNKLSCDLNLGTGIRYIWSTNSGKKNIGANLQKETLTKKEFDSGQKFAQRLSFQFRIGYAF